ncbi:unnamed protein product [Spirodela intermedia]|uniref:protein-disulfide reductase n=1 Tax=Spirodela intermedia TaxID=51605 RepID=A0A7I8J312_SPIIN|nr:unnamed protein product [Spirodela intermedia]CAA6664627.1 unnamed protein product [Spirodela intermedia]
MEGLDGGKVQDLASLLSGEGRDYVVRKNSDKIVAIYFSGHWCPPCRRFTPCFEVVFVSSDRDEESFNEYFDGMPWLAVPFCDAAARRRIKELFNVRGIPLLVVLDGSTGKVLTTEGVGVVREYGTAGFPFSSERRRNQTLKTLLASGSRDFVIRSNGDKVPITEIEGKIVCLYFFAGSFPPCVEFQSTLSEMYGELKNRGSPSRNAVAGSAVQDKTIEKLTRYFELSTIPTLVVIAPDGKTLNPNAAEIVEEHGVDAYPFSPERLAELVELERQREESQTLESVLVSGSLDYVIGKNGSKVPVSELVGKNVLLYFSAHWCPPCRVFTPKLIQVYHEIKARDAAFEVEYYSSMPWLALPLGDPRKKSLNQRFKIDGIPSLVAIGPSGRTVTTEARDMIEERGSAAYPFTDDAGLGGDDDDDEEKEDEKCAAAAAPEGYVCEGDVCRKA